LTENRERPRSQHVVLRAVLGVVLFFALALLFRSRSSLPEGRVEAEPLLDVKPQKREGTTPLKHAHALVDVCLTGEFRSPTYLSRRLANGSRVRIEAESGCARFELLVPGRLDVEVAGAVGTPGLDVFLDEPGHYEYELEVVPPCLVSVLPVTSAGEVVPAEVVLAVGRVKGRAFQVERRVSATTVGPSPAMFEAPCGLDARASTEGPGGRGSTSFTVTSQMSVQELLVRQPRASRIVLVNNLGVRVVGSLTRDDGPVEIGSEGWSIVDVVEGQVLGVAMAPGYADQVVRVESTGEEDEGIQRVVMSSAREVRFAFVGPSDERLWCLDGEELGLRCEWQAPWHVCRCRDGAVVASGRWQVGLPLQLPSQGSSAAIRLELPPPTVLCLLRTQEGSFRVDLMPVGVARHPLLGTLDLDVGAGTETCVTVPDGAPLTVDLEGTELTHTPIGERDTLVLD